MDAQKIKPIQDEYLGKVKANNKNVTIYLTSGLPIRGKIKDFDHYSLLWFLMLFFVYLKNYHKEF